MKAMISVVVCVKDGEECVGNCIESILNQTFQNFELIMIDDYSSDKTCEIINDFKDERIRYFQNKEWKGVTKSRNFGVKQARGKYVFFTDADCVVNKEWLAEGLRSFENYCVGVEGKIVYVSENYEQNFSDYVMENRYGGQFMTGNTAYRCDLLKAIGGLNESLRYFSDRELGLRMNKYGRICFNKNMVVTHPWVEMTPKKLFYLAAVSEDRIYLFKTFGDKSLLTWRIMNIRNFVKIFCPWAILASFFFHSFKKPEDFRLLPFTFVAAIIERFHILKASAKNRVFII